MKFRTFYDIKDSDIGACNAGDGKAVKQYHLDEKLHQIVPTIDEKTGERITHNLYEDIQNNLDYTNYKKLLEINGLPPMSPIESTGEVVDYTNIGSYGEILKANNKIYKQTGKTADQLVKDYLSKSQNKLDNTNKEEVKSSQSQVVTEDKNSK